MTPPVVDLVTVALRELIVAFGHGSPSVAAYAPGRCTIVGEHVDYAGGLVLGAAIDLGVAVAIRASPDRLYRAVSADRQVKRVDPSPVGDIGDRIFAAATALREHGIDVPVFEAAVAATLPEGAGLASSAAVTCATLLALARLTDAKLSPSGFAATAFHAEHDLVGVPCGFLDQRMIVDAPHDGLLLLDCRDATSTPQPWPFKDVVLCLCSTDQRHDVGGSGYRTRRQQVEAALARVGVDSCQDLTATAMDAARLAPMDARRLRHVSGETALTALAVRTLRNGDARMLGSLMSESHRSLRDNFEVSTPLLDRVVAAAETVPGCLGARLVGAGFGGSVLALTYVNAAEACRETMATAAHVGVQSTWTLAPAPGLALQAADVINLRDA